MSEQKSHAENILKEIKGIDNNVTNVIVPILRDTISDYRKVVNKLIVIIVILIVAIASLGTVGYIVIANEVEKYNEFLSQFEFESEDTIYQETTDNSIINSGININSKD